MSLGSVIANSSCSSAGTVMLANVAMVAMAAFLHLIFGNLLVGLIEGLLLSAVFRTSPVRTVPLLVGANYFSAWLGGYWFLLRVAGRLSPDIHEAWRYTWLFVAAAYGLTLLLEWPFVAAALRRTRHWLRNSLLGSLLVQTATYGLLLLWYCGVARATLYTEMRLVPLAEFPLRNSQTVVFYIGEDGKEVFRFWPLLGRKERVAKLKSAVRADRLLFRRSKAEQGKWDLVALLAGSTDRDPKYETVLAGLEVAVPLPRAEYHWRIAAEPDSPWHVRPLSTQENFGAVPALAEANESSWTIQTGLWPREGVWAQQGKGARQLRLCFQGIFFSWVVRNAVHLPGDQVLFQLGPRQVCLWDLATKRVALVDYGFGPTAACTRSD